MVVEVENVLGWDLMFLLLLLFFYEVKFFESIVVVVKMVGWDLIDDMEVFFNEDVDDFYV